MKKIRKFLLQNKAFTLIELLVSISVITILATIAFNSYSWYSMKSRDSVRMVDVEAINNSLITWVMYTWYYPTPSNWEIITYSWSTVWIQWTIWESVIFNLKENRDIPLDPLTWKEYTYSVLNTWKEYQLASALEELSFEHNNIFKKVNAWDNTGFAYVLWDFNWIFTQVRILNRDYFIAIPSIITSTIDTLENIISNNNFVINWLSNLPANYSSSKFNINWSSSSNFLNSWEYSMILYNWCCFNLKKDVDTYFNIKKDIINNLQNLYSWTEIANDEDIQYLLNLDTNTDNNELIEYIDYMFDELYIIPWCIEADYYCNTSSPSYANSTNSTWLPTSANQSWTFNQTPWNCTYACNTDYTWNWIICVANIYNCAIPEPSYANSTNSTLSASSFDQDWEHNETPWSCTFACDTNYTWDWTSSCVANEFNCFIPEPTNSTNVALTATSYDQVWQSSNSSDPCYFTCDTNYTSNWTSCVADEYNCATPEPTNSTITPWTATSYDQVWQSSNSSDPCYFTCDTDYTSNWTSCVPDSYNCYIPNPSYTNSINSPWTATSAGQVWVQNDTPWTWDCSYACINWYSWSDCATIYWACYDNWISVPSEPTNLCTAWNASEVIHTIIDWGLFNSDTAIYDWTCIWEWEWEWITANCSVDHIINWDCVNYDWITVTEAPTDLCNEWNPSSVSNPSMFSDKYTWDCDWSYWWTDDSCEATEE